MLEQRIKRGHFYQDDYDHKKIAQLSKIAQKSAYPPIPNNPIFGTVIAWQNLRVGKLSGIGNTMVIAKPLWHNIVLMQKYSI